MAACDVTQTVLRITSVLPHSFFCTKLQALVYDILLPTTAINDYDTGLQKTNKNQQKNQLNEKKFCGAQMAASLYKTTQIISGVSVITAHVAYARTNKTKII